MKKIDLAYLAGFFDGEGSISLYKSGRQYQLEVCLANTNEWVVNWLDFNFPATLWLEKRSLKDPKRKDIWRWQLRSIKAKHFLQTLMPYLKIKKPQAELAIRFLERKTKGKHKTLEHLALDEADRILLHYYNVGRSI